MQTFIKAIPWITVVVIFGLAFWGTSKPSKHGKGNVPPHSNDE